MSLLGIIETLRRNLKGVITACWVLLALVVIADVARVMTGFGHHAAAPVGEHAVAAAATHATTSPEHAMADLTAEHPAGFHEEAAPAHGFWASAYHIAETIPVFWTLFGFLGCVLIVVVSKTYGHLGVSEREDYYSE